MKSRGYKDRLKGHQDVILQIYSPYGPETSLLYSISKDGLLRIWDLFERKIQNKLILSRTKSEIDTEEERKHVSKANEIICAMFQQNCVYGGFRDGQIYLWNIKDGEILSQFQAHSSTVKCIKRLNQRVFVTTSKDKTCSFWDSMTGEKENTLEFPAVIDDLKIFNSKLYFIVGKTYFYEIDAEYDMNSAFYSDYMVHDSKLYLADCDRNLKVYSMNNLHTPIKEVQLGTWALCMRAEQNYLYVGTDNHVIKIYDINSFQLMDELVGHEDGICQIEFAGGMLYSASFDHTIRSWDLQEMKSRIYEKSLMFFEDIRSRKQEAYQKILQKKKKKKKGKKSGQKKK